MKRARVTLYPADADLPLAFERATGADEAFVDVQVVNWNVSPSPAAFLLRIAGDRQRFEALLARDETVDEYEFLPVSDHESYCFVTGPGTADAQALWEHFETGSLMTIPPAEWNADGSYSFRIVGRERDIQSAVASVPEGARIEVDAVGGTTVAPDSVRDRLSDRQREAVEAAVRLGYYEVPRTATTEEVAAELDCAVSTAAEHLRKAESKVFEGLFRA